MPGCSKPGWQIGTSRPDGLTLAALVDQIDHICQLAGNALHAAIGSDLDGGYGTEQTPGDLQTHCRFAKARADLAQARLQRDRHRQHLSRQLAAFLPPLAAGVSSQRDKWGGRAL